MRIRKFQKILSEILSNYLCVFNSNGGFPPWKGILSNSWQQVIHQLPSQRQEEIIQEYEGKWV